MEHQQFKNNSIPAAAEYLTEEEIKTNIEQKLEIAVKYCVEYAKQEAFGFNIEEEFEKEKVSANKLRNDLFDHELALEDVEIHWKEEDAKEKELTLKINNWLGSEKTI